MPRKILIEEEEESQEPQVHDSAGKEQSAWQYIHNVTSNPITSPVSFSIPTNHLFFYIRKFDLSNIYIVLYILKHSNRVL